jgi:hypothetical protein
VQILSDKAVGSAESIFKIDKLKCWQHFIFSEDSLEMCLIKQKLKKLLSSFNQKGIINNLRLQ